MSQVDLLVFAAHPDDAEIGIGGLLAKHHAAGFKTAICHLTEAELSSNGTVERRREEAKKAAEILGVSKLINLGFPDRGLTGSPEQILRITQVIRQYRPHVVLAPYYEDRHPDHVACSRMVKEAIFDAAIRKKQTPGNEPAHRVNQFYYYFINDITQPDLIVDVSDVYELKMAAIKAYASQFNRQEGEMDTPLNQPSYLAMIQGRDSIWGYQIGALYGEGLISPKPLKTQLLISRDQ
ncbi:bacillithiol biosynthesis deacetylase BshB1 [Thermoflavimicrobium dichotomicum]|uniref:Bacillithiol biosynthesis deacetylase BshB1 n=1 Tax=Thermoflavimicrobium dichotomicum TaxID=46223 RepID=A0A1I3SLB3_9BACL|nr:bacillithiol biosynthesis deacetylase BshB1 [Thermoflavimicrobium dichotomicum]SFJ59170.1 bacillithiol biosynthesis deacetylase BshB1 [Thermoflavimicrobium dichotomicum]